MQFKQRAFTITEIIVVVVIMSIITAFAIPTYNKAIKANLERQFILKLEALGGALEIFRARNGAYWVPSDQIGQETGTADFFTSPGYSNLDPLVVEIVREQMYPIFEDMKCSVYDDYYRFRDFGREYYVVFYTGGFCPLGPGNVIVNRGWYTENICCSGTTCKFLPECVAL